VEIKSNIINADWDIMSNGKKRRPEIMLNTGRINADWDIMARQCCGSGSGIFSTLDPG
jgi:hypothetical protein